MSTEPPIAAKSAEPGVVDPPSEPPRTLGLLAEFPGPDELVAAAEKTTDDGYRKVEAYSPFPIHGIDDALKSKRTILPWIVFCCGLTGCLIALAMQYYVNAAEGPWPFAGYEYRISGKPYFSLPANIPVTFEVIILLSSFGAFFGMLALNGLPRLSNPLFRNERFLTATSHGFFLWVDSGDGKFGEDETTSYFQSIGATGVEPVYQETEGHDFPSLLVPIGAVLTTIAIVPPLWVAAAAGPSSQPRLSIWWDMDYQPKYKTQSTASGNLFADGRTMRKQVPGTVARGMLQDDLRYYRGIEREPDAIALAKRPATQFVNLLQNEAGEDETDQDEAGEDAATDETADAATDGQPKPPEPDWVEELPIEVTAAAMDRGQQRFNIYCATCHGLGGDGDGLITQRAMATRQGTWVTPTSIHSPDVLKQPPGKIFHSISNGVRRMPGYSQQITAEDRWNIVLYLKALQRGRAANAEDVPEEQMAKMRK